MGRNTLPLVTSAFVFFLQGLVPEVRTVREGQHQQAPLTPSRGLDGHSSGGSDRATLPLGAHTKGHSLAVGNSTGSVDGAACRSTKAKWLKQKKDLKIHVVPVPALPAEDKSATSIDWKVTGPVAAWSRKMTEMPG